MNILRCTLPALAQGQARRRDAAKYFIAALDRTYELYRETGRKLLVANSPTSCSAILAPPPGG